MVTEVQKQELIKAASHARERAYAPYSHFDVGAAILAEDGQIITGVNVENVSFGLTICAEQAAVANAVSQGVKNFVAIAVSSPNAVSPCGACRQVLSEFAGDIPVLLSDKERLVSTTTLHTLLPECFTPEHLRSAQE